jgi:hypothetical protein
MAFSDEFLDRVAECESSNEGTVVVDRIMNAEYLARVQVYGAEVAELAIERGINYDVPIHVSRRGAGRLGRLARGTDQLGGWSLTARRSWYERGEPRLTPIHYPTGFYDSGILLMLDGTFRDYTMFAGSSPVITAAEAKDRIITPLSETAELMTHLADFAVRNGLVHVNNVARMA